MIARMFNQDAEAYTNTETIQAVLRTYIRASKRVHKPTSNGVSIFVFPESGLYGARRGEVWQLPKIKSQEKRRQAPQRPHCHSYP